MYKTGMVVFCAFVGMLIGAIFGELGFFIGGALGLWIGFGAADQHEKEQKNELKKSANSSPLKEKSPSPKTKNAPLSPMSFDSNTTMYSSVVPELIAACISADGETTEAEVDLATQLLENDDLIPDKLTALQSLNAHLETLLKARQTARPIYKLKITTVIHRALELNDPLERARVLVILDGMLEIAGSKPQDEMRHFIAEVKKGWRGAPEPLSKMQAAEEFVLKSGDQEAISAFRKMKENPARYGEGFRKAAQGNSVMRIALGVFTGMIAAELVTGAIYQHQLQAALAQFDMELASMGGLENLSFEASPLDTPTFQTASWQETGDDISSDADDDEVIEESETDEIEDADIDSDFDFLV